MGIDRRSFTTASVERARTAAPTGSVAAPVSAIDPVLPDEHAGRDEPVHGEERGHDREPAGDDHRAGVTAPRPDRHQHERRGGSDERAHADAVEVHPQRRHHHHAAEQPEPEHGQQAPPRRAGGSRRSARATASQRYRQDWAGTQAPRRTPALFARGLGARAASGARPRSCRPRASPRPRCRRPRRAGCGSPAAAAHRARRRSPTRRRRPGCRSAPGRASPA